MLIDEVAYSTSVSFSEGGCGEGIGTPPAVKAISPPRIRGFEVHELHQNTDQELQCMSLDRSSSSYRFHKVFFGLILPGFNLYRQPVVS